MPLPRISILIPTIGDTNRLRGFLDQLDRLSANPDIEVLLIVNSLQVPDYLFVIASDYGFKLLHEPRRGKSRALNLGIAASQGEWIVFTDDDVRLPDDWLIKLIPGDIPDSINILGGRTLNDGCGPEWIEKSRNLHELLLCRHDLGSENVIYRYGKYPIGPNMAVRKKAIIKSNANWPIDQGPGTSLPVGDETVFLSKISSANDKDRLYISDAVVYHPIDSRYLSIRAAARRTFLGGYACGLIESSNGNPESRNFSKPYDVIKQLRSIRELICTATRAIGFAMGHLARKKQCKHCPPT